METVQVQVNAEYLTTFQTFGKWVNKVTSQLGGHDLGEKIICLDKNGNAVTIGKDFKYASDNNLFPITCYRLIRTHEVPVIKFPEQRAIQFKTFKGDDAMLITNVPPGGMIVLSALPKGMDICLIKDRALGASPTGIVSEKNLELVGMLNELTEEQAKDIYYLKFVSWSHKNERLNNYGFGSRQFETFKEAMLFYIKYVLEINIDPATTCLLKIKE